MLTVNFSKSELIYYGGDEPRHFMNGVFYKDFFWDKGWKSPIDYTICYYAQYPALSIYQYPPFFYLLEAAAFNVFGVSKNTAQWLSFLIVITGLYYFFKYVNEKFNRTTALLSSLLFISTTIFLKNYGNVIIDIPSLSLMLIFLYYFDRWDRLRDKKTFIYAALFLALTVMTAIKTAFVLFFILVFLAYKFIAQKSGLSRKRVLIILYSGIVLFFVAFGTSADIAKIPFFYRTLHGYEMVSLFDIKELILEKNLSILITKFQLIKNFGYMRLLLCLLGGIFAYKNGEKNKFLFYFLFSITFFAVFFTIGSRRFASDRFNLYLLPCVSLAAGYGANSLIKLTKNRTRLILLVSLILYLSTNILSTQARVFKGYKAAAEEVLKLNKDKNPILIDASLDGTFIAYIRMYDNAREQVIFRGDKILYASNLYLDNIEKIYVFDEQSVYEILDKYSIRFILVDKKFLEITPKSILRQVLKNNKTFKYIKTFSVETNMEQHDGSADLGLYEYKQYKKNYEEQIEIYVGAMNRTITFRIKDIKDKKNCTKAVRK